MSSVAEKSAMAAVSATTMGRCSAGDSRPSQAIAASRPSWVTSIQLRRLPISGRMPKRSSKGAHRNFQV